MNDLPSPPPMIRPLPGFIAQLEYCMEGNMSHEPLLKWIFRHAWTFAVPAAILLSSALLPLQPIVRQAMIGILLIWFQITLMFGMPSS
jgi:hypothetical protein